MTMSRTRYSYGGRTRLPAALAVVLLVLGGCASNELSEASIEPPKPAIMPAEMIEVVLAEADMELALGKCEKAYPRFNAVLRTEPGNPRATLGAAECQLSGGQLAESLAGFESLMDVPWMRARALQGRGVILSILGQNRMGQDLLMQAVADDPGLWRAWNAIGRNHDMEGEWDKALVNYDRALAVNAGAPSIYNNRGVAQLMQGRYEAAAKSFRQALMLDADSAVAQMNLRLAIAWQGRYREALSGLKADRLPEALNNVGFIAMRRGDYDVAETYFRQAMAKSPSFYEKAAENLEYLKQVKRSASSAGAQG